MKLSILIPTLQEPDSQNYLKRLLKSLPIIEGVEIITDDSPRDVPTGTKRNSLISRANGEYISQIDCDDIVPEYYVSELLKAMESNPDVVTFNGFMTTNAMSRKNFVIKLGERYEERNGVYYRYPNHLCAFKKSVVEQVKFRPIWVQEDYFWATELRDKKILKTSVHIDKDMYHYDYKTKKNNAIGIMQSRRR
jgi:glycosyltransferase involved in cell wall biosynthesis